MPNQTRGSHTVLMLAAAAIVLAACGGKDPVSPADVEAQAFEDLRTEIRDVIDDPEREAEVLIVVDDLSQSLAALRNSISERDSKVRQLNANYDTPRSDFEAFFEQIYVQIQSNQEHVTKNHNALLVATTPEEWALISKSRTKAMYAAINTIQTD